MRHDTSSTLKVVIVLGLLLVLGGLPASADQEEEPTHLTGRLVTRSIHMDIGAEPLHRTGYEVNTIITVRMRRVGSQWVDDGSRFRASGMYAHLGPFAQGPRCTIFVDENRWLQEARFDAADPLTGQVPSYIVLTTDPATGVAELLVVMQGGRFGSIYGDSCAGDPAQAQRNSDRDLADCRARGGGTNCAVCRHGDSTTRCAWETITALQVINAQPVCPLTSGRLQGRIDSTGSRIDFTCADVIEGPSAWAPSRSPDRPCSGCAAGTSGSACGSSSS
jgi:hypothetical protein